MGRPVLGSGLRKKSKRKTKMKLSEWRLKLTDGGRYFYDGWTSDEGITFLFEEDRDAVIFKLRWV